MQAKDPLVSRPTRPIKFVATFAVALAAALCGVALLGSVSHSSQTPKISAHAAMSSSPPDNQAPDAKERNDIYARALAARYNNQSPDAQERNLRLSGR
jgi:hypothetical protein